MSRNIPAFGEVKKIDGPQSATTGPCEDSLVNQSRDPSKATVEVLPGSRSLEKLLHLVSLIYSDIESGKQPIQGIVGASTALSMQVRYHIETIGCR